MRQRNLHILNWLIGFVIFLLLAVISPPVKSGALQPVIEVQTPGKVQIEPANNYSENTRLRIRLLYPPDHPRAGEVMTGLPGTVTISEYVTRIYDGAHGATRLPMSVTAAEGEWDVLLKSLARYTVPDQRFAPVPKVEVRYAGSLASVRVPQWVDNDGDEQMDWLQQRVDDLIAAMQSSGIPEVMEVISALEGWHESYRIECGGIDPGQPYVARIGPSCLNWDGENDHRLNTHQELTATLLHEARHVWQRRQGMMAQGREDTVFARNTGKPGCERTQNDCFTQYVVGNPHSAYLEEDAELFANRYKGLFP